jgi:hypothetical protein
MLNIFKSIRYTFYISIIVFTRNHQQFTRSFSISLSTNSSIELFIFVIQSFLSQNLYSNARFQSLFSCISSASPNTWFHSLATLDIWLGNFIELSFYDFIRLSFASLLKTILKLDRSSAFPWTVWTSLVIR